MRRLLTAVLVATLTLLGLCGQPPSAEAATVRITKVTGGLTIPWGLTWVGNLMLFNERGGAVWTQRPGQAARRVSLPMPAPYTQSETGLLGMVADPGAASNGYFYTCQAMATSTGAAKDVQVWKWRLTSDTRAAKVKTLITGIPVNKGRHNGCRLRFRSSQMLYVGTGDAAQGTNPQNLKSLGGKVLRVRSDGSIPTSNPFYSKGGNARYVWTYGHRNIQGLTRRPGVDQMWSVEHGTDRDDEINYIVKSQNYGWSPTPGYNEARSMTDLKRYPKARTAKWRTGYPTKALSGATFLSGSRWGSWNGRLAVAMLKGKGIRLYTVSSSNSVTYKQTVATSYGRIRTVEQGPDGALYFTTSNGSGDGIYRLTYS